MIIEVKDYLEINFWNDIKYSKIGKILFLNNYYFYCIINIKFTIEITDVKKFSEIIF